MRRKTNLSRVTKYAYESKPLACCYFRNHEHRVREREREREREECKLLSLYCKSAKCVMVQNWPVQLEMHSNNCKVFAGMAQCPLGGCNNNEWKGALTGLIERDRSVNVMTGWKEFYAHRNSILAQKK